MLVTLAEMKSYLGISATTYDVFLTEQIQMVSDVIEAYCRRSFNQATYEETFYNDAHPYSADMMLFHFPMTSVVSIVEDGVTVDDTTYRIHTPSARIRKTEGYFFGAKETVVTYVAGYSVVPSPVRGALYSIVQERYNKKTSGVDLNFGSDVQRISIPGSISIDFDYSLSNNDRKTAFGVVLGSQVNVLDHYRSERAVVGNDKLVYLDSSVPPYIPFGTYAAPITVTAVAGVPASFDQRQIAFVKSAGGAVTVTANPQIAVGVRVGQEMIIEGTSDTDYITLNNGNGLGLNGPVNLIDRQTITLVWDGVLWTETARN